jgi:RsiW-degrading membrane proteinase PrsW (M82 family)
MTVQPAPSQPFRWRIFLLGAFHLINLAGLVLSALFATTGAALTYFNGERETVLMQAILAAGMFCGAILLCFPFYYNFRAMGGDEDRPFVMRMNIRLGIPMLVLAWPLILMLGNFISTQGSFVIQALLLPVLTVAGITIPILAITWLAIHQLPKESTRRIWDIFALGMTLGPLVIIIIEILALGIFIAGVALVVSFNPEWSAFFVNLGQNVENLTPLQAQSIVADLVSNPWLPLIGIAMLSFIVPVVEEPLKVIGVWLAADRIRTPAEGFVLGILSGAGYAVFESLGASAAGVAGWMSVTGARAGTSLLHIFNSGLIGWALVSAWQERKYMRLGLAFALSIIVHGLWNASTVAFGIAGMSRELPFLLPDYLNDPTVYLVILVSLLTFMMTLLLGFNRILQPAPALPVEQVEYNQPLPTPDSGENETNGNPDHLN